jgi:hypothetical protein
MKAVLEHIKANQSIRLITYAVTSTSENRMKKLLAVMLRQRDCLVLLSPIYTCLKELIINAVKANYKNIYFENYTPKNQADSLIDYHMALQLFKLEISREDSKNLSRIARKRNITAEIEFLVNDEDILSLRVTNPVPMTSSELKTVRKKLEDARVCNDISEYFLMNADNPENEGAGVGLVLIAMILRGLGVELSTFEISCDETTTTASLLIPLTTETVRHYRENTSA